MAKKQHKRVNLMHDFIPENVRNNIESEAYLDELAEVFAPYIERGEYDREDHIEHVHVKVEKIINYLTRLKEDLDDKEGQKKLQDEIHAMMKKLNGH